jgi:hypothetical protein
MRMMLAIMMTMTDPFLRRRGLRGSGGALGHELVDDAHGLPATRQHESNKCPGHHTAPGAIHSRRHHPPQKLRVFIYVWLKRRHKKVTR